MQRGEQSRAFVCSGLLLAIGASALLAGCGSKEEPPPQIPVRQIKKEQPKEDPTAKMAHAAIEDRSNVPIDLKYEFAAKPVVDVPVEIDLALLPAAGADSMAVALEPSPGLTLSDDSTHNFDLVKSGKIEHIKLTAMAKEATAYYVKVTATMYNAGTSSERSFAIPMFFSQPESGSGGADGKADESHGSNDSGAKSADSEAQTTANNTAAKK